MTDHIEWVCEHCFGGSCAHCDPDIAADVLAQMQLAQSTAEAIDAILTGAPIGGDAA